MSHQIINFNPGFVFPVSFVDFPWGLGLNAKRVNGCFGKHFLVINHILLSHTDCQCEFTMVQGTHGTYEVLCILGWTCWGSMGSHGSVVEDVSCEGYGDKLQFLHLSFWYNQIYWSLGNFLQIISLARLVGCLKAELRDSGKKYFKIWSATNLCFMISHLDSTQGYQKWHQGAATVVSPYMLFGLLVPRRNWNNLGNRLAEYTDEVVTVDASLCVNVYMPISQVPVGV